MADDTNTQMSPSPTRFLLDTNAFIALEPFAGQMESGMGPAATFMRLAMKQGNRIFVHPASRDELVEGKNPDRVRQRLAELDKFEMLDESPVSAQLRAELGPVVPDSNNDRDLRILAALHANAANFLVSDDAGLHKRAKRVGIGDRVLTLNDATAMLEGLEPTVASPPPHGAPSAILRTGLRPKHLRKHQGRLRRIRQVDRQSPERLRQSGVLRRQRSGW